MRLTKKKAIEITKELWEYLAETGRGLAGKYNWSGWKKYGQMCFACPCCEYRQQHISTLDKDLAEICIKCPLYGQWDGQDFCMTIYVGWCGATTKAERKRAAQKIVDICDKALK